jgi:hypothetical protein
VASDADLQGAVSQRADALILYVLLWAGRWRLARRAKTKAAEGVDCSTYGCRAELPQSSSLDAGKLYVLS